MPIDAAVRAERTRIHNERNAVSVVFLKPLVVNGDGTVTPEVALAAQSVRITSDSRASVMGGTAGVAPKHAVVVFGIKGHLSAPDNDIAVGYVFQFDGDTYRVNKVIPVPGGLQALATTG